MASDLGLSQRSRYSPEARVGKRAEQKRRWDRENKLTCVCGRSMNRGYSRCRQCTNDLRRAARDDRYRSIQAMWNQGASMYEIAVALGMTRGTLSFHLDVMRREGWNVPHRHNYPLRGA